MYKDGKKIAVMLADVRDFFSSVWENRYSELRLGDCTLITERGNIEWDGLFIFQRNDSGSYFTLPAEEDTPPEINGLMYIVNSHGVWQGVEVHRIAGHELGKCDKDCVHLSTLANCRTPEMRARMVMDMNDAGEEY